MTLLERAPAKINLTLRVLSRRADGYHELESLVAFADVADILTLQPDAKDGLEITGPFAGKSGPVADNLVLKARAALGKYVAGLRGGYFRLEKNIPVAAGLGGGSADAGAALRLLARVNGLTVEDSRLLSAALATGADVPVCLDSRPRIMRGIGESLSEPINLPTVRAVLVNPRVALETRDVFGKFAGPQIGNGLVDVPREIDALIEFLKRHDNDLTNAASACASVVGEVLDALRALPRVRLARMSGSGPTCFALFDSHGDAATAAQELKVRHNDWWIQSVTIASGSGKS